MIGVPVLLGGRRFENKKLYNSVFLVETTGTSNNIYDKIKLVPFGSISFGGILSRVGF